MSPSTVPPKKKRGPIPGKKRGSYKKKKVTPKAAPKAAPKAVSNKKKATRNKKKAAPKPDMALPRGNSLCLPRGKVSKIPFPQREGRNFAAATTDCLALGVSEKKAWKNLTTYCHKHPHLDCPILPSTMSNTLEGVRVIFFLHYPGDKHIDEMIEKGLLWLTRNGYLGEICLRFLTSTINRTIYHTEDLNGNCLDNIAFTDINMCPAPNNCGGDHNHEALQTLTEDVLIATIGLCPNANIFFFGKKPNQYAANSFLQRLQKEGLADIFPEEFWQGSDSFFSNCRYLTHPQFYLMQLNTIDHTKDLFRFVAYVIDAIFGVDIRHTLLTMDEAGIQQIVPFANQAMIEARSLAQSEMMTALWDDPDHIFNSEEYRDKMSKLIKAVWDDPEYRDNFITKRNDPNGAWKDFGKAMKGLWDDPDSVFNSEDYRDKLSEGHKNRSIPFNPKAKKHSRNQWRKSGLLCQPYQCAKCGTQYEGENYDYLQHMENCNHTTTMFTSAQLKLQELPGNSPQTVKEDSESKKNLEQSTQERRQRFIINKGNFHRLQKNLHKYKRTIDKLQKNKIERQVQYEVSEMQREKEELQQRIQDADDAWIKTPLPDEVFDNVDMDGNVSYTMGPYKYNLEWYDFQKKCDQDQSYKYPPFATDYEKNWKPRKEGYLIRKKKREDELFKKYGTKVIRTTE